MALHAPVTQTTTVPMDSAFCKGLYVHPTRSTMALGYAYALWDTQWSTVNACLQGPHALLTAPLRIMPASATKVSSTLVVYAPNVLLEHSGHHSPKSVCMYVGSIHSTIQPSGTAAASQLLDSIQLEHASSAQVCFTCPVGTVLPALSTQSTIAMHKGVFARTDIRCLSKESAWLSVGQTKYTTPRLHFATALLTVLALRESVCPV